MSTYRVKQFFWSIFSKVTKDDIKYINSKLNEDEKSLLFKLAKGEIKHSIRIAKAIEEKYDDIFIFDKINTAHKVNVIKVALLHDIGKINKRLNVIDKSILVILDKISKGKLNKYSYIKKVGVYYNHGIMGASILKRLGYDDYWVWVVENHHNHNVIDNNDVSVLQHYDNIY